MGEKDMVETVARILHNAGVEYLRQSGVQKEPDSWESVIEPVRNGRRFEARYLIDNLQIELKKR